MTYKELYEKAIWLLEHNEINGKEYDKMIEPLNTEIIDAEPVRHGEFIGKEYDGYDDGNPVYCEWVCSECGCVFEDEEPKYRYCPNCGAKMDGETKEKP